eukprot:11795395-Ditylum_brightwellii.AAC.1
MFALDYFHMQSRFDQWIYLHRQEVRLESCEGKGLNGPRVIMLTLKKVMPCFISGMANWTFLLLQSPTQIIPIDEFH